MHYLIFVVISVGFIACSVGFYFLNIFVDNMSLSLITELEFLRKQLTLLSEKINEMENQK
jgi:hypothetical protein